ncbi:thioesterase II family protein [Streptomyces griseochromogenes]|uniref:thioesterase II family protein n=1 Tax=Streptomyces griseochromogenes TaxID=68214 RepID=UPI00379768E1
MCLPHAGGAANFYHSWARWLPDGVELLTVQYPGRQDRIGEPCLSRMDDLAPEVVAALRPWLDAPAPLVLFGHSMGAWVAFEVALRLETSLGYRPLGLLVSGQTAPHLPPLREWPGDTDEELFAELRRLGGIDMESIEHPDLRELVMPAIRSDFQLVRDYPPRPPRRISAPIVALNGTTDPDVPLDQVDAWRDATLGAFRSHVFPGGHFYLTEHETQVADEVTRTLRWLTGDEEPAVPRPTRTP